MINVRIESKQFKQSTQVLGNIEFSVEPGELICILGNSGTGKTTLLNIIAGLDKNFRGSVSEAKCAYMFQEPRLLPWRTVRQNLEIIRDDPARIDELLNICALTEAQHQFPTQISLGMARRAALARCLLVEPEMVLMDEPMVSLDSSMATTMRDQLGIMRTQRPEIAVLYVTHDIEEALALADRLIVLSGRPAEVIFEETNNGNKDELKQKIRSLL